jgi:uncharacterized protein with NRDE domain
VCTLAVFAGTLPELPLLVAANRDELLDRPAATPTLLRESAPRAFGGRDLVAGGTWLGVNEDRLVVGLLNRRSATPPDPALRSRGLLCLDLLGCRTAAEASTHMGAVAERYNPFNLLIADPAAAFVVSQSAGGAPAVTRLEPGLHLLSNLDVNDPRCPRIAASHRGFAEAGAAYARDRDEPALVARLGALLADHATALDPRGPGRLCVHGEGYGTRSSTVILIPAAGRPLHYLHADGPPCRTPLTPVAVPF